MRWVSWFKRLIGRDGADHKKASVSDPAFIRSVVMAMGKTEEVEFSCNEVYELMDQYAEMVARGEDAAQLMPLVRHHLEMCPDCREEFEALLHILEASSPGI